MNRTPLSLQKPGHILFIAGEYPPMIGGVGDYTAQLGAALVARGWQVSVLTSSAAQSSPAETVPVKAGPITVYPVMERWGWGVLPKALQIAKEVGADLIHVQYQPGSFHWHAAINFAPLWWQRQGMPVVATYHDLASPRLLPRGRLLRRWARDMPARVCARTIATNAGDYGDLAPLARKLVSIPIGSNISARFFSDEERRARREQRGYGDNDLVVGYFGFVNSGKGAMNLVEILARLLLDEPTVHLLMIGAQVRIGSVGNEPYWQRVQENLRVHGLHDRVKVTGYQPDAEVSADLAACDCLLLPYADGASPRRGSLMAGLTHGCAIVTTTPKMPFPELVGGRDVLFVAYEDLDGVVAAILKIAHDPELKAMLRQNALTASDAFTWARIAEAHEQFYFQANPEDALAG